ncbi:hypothetical protein EDB87DRAFT_571095 [Lactarius vividus]|nr:hypothetical protein EDB87DRAFT_571095 [Lactarius vividus]
MGLQMLVSGLTAVAVWRYSMIAAYVVCFYDWVISLDQEVALVHAAPWNGVKAAYIFCRYYPMAIAPFHLWGLVGNHEQRVSQLILMLRTYAFSGRKTRVLVVLSITYLGLAGFIIWVLSKELTLSPLFFFTKRNACFAISDEPNITLAGLAVGGNRVRPPVAYHVGMISVLATFFDCLNIFVVLWHWLQGRDTLGPLGKSFLKQGILVYVVMTVLNTLAICAFLSSYLVRHGLAASSLFAYTMPSALACRLKRLRPRQNSVLNTHTWSTTPLR